MRLVDTQANEYGAAHRYIVDQQITVLTTRVDQVSTAEQKTMQLSAANPVKAWSTNSTA